MLKRGAADTRGRRGEDAAAAFLERTGAKILARNWRSGRLEVDIICIHEGTLVFVEVKTRDKNGMTRPDEALTATKKTRLIRAARNYIAKHAAWDSPCRFDLICVSCDRETCDVEHYPHAFDLTDFMGGGNAAWQPW